MAEIVSEQVSVRLNDEEKQMLDAYQKKHPALSRAGCFVQMLYETTWQAEENGKTARLKRIEENAIAFESVVNHKFDEVIARLERMEQVFLKEMVIA